MTRSGPGAAPRSVAVATRAFGAALGLLPRAARRSMRTEATDLFARLASDAHRRAGALAVVGVWLRSIFDLILQAVREYREPGPPLAVRRPIPRVRIDPMGNLASDIRQAVRGLLDNSVYATVVLATLALGIGANTAIFTLVNAVLIEPLGYPEPDRLVRLWGTEDGVPKDSGTIAYLNFVDVRARTDVFAKAAAYDEWQTTLTGAGDPERIDAAQVNVEYFDVLGVTPAVGRFFLPEEDTDGRDRVVVLSHGFWSRQFGADPSVVGSTLVLNGNPHTVVGVTPPGFEDPRLSGDAWEVPALWRPLGYDGVGMDRLPSRGSSSYTAIGRLAEGVSREAAAAEVARQMEVLEGEYPNNNLGEGMTLMPLRDTIVGSARASLLMLLGAVVLVLAIATANVTGLMVARAADRRRETALRLALGAGRGRLLQLFLTESLLLASLGGLLGMGLARLLVSLLQSAGGTVLPRTVELTPDIRVLAFTAGISLLAGLACGLAPLRTAFRADLQAMLQGTRSTVGSGDAPVSGRALVVAEVALAVVLLVGALLLLRSFVALTGVDTGIDTDDTLAFDIALPYRGYSENADHTRFFDELLGRLEAVPGVHAAATINILPMSANFDCNGTRAADLPEPPPNEGPCPEVRTVSPGYFDTIGIELLRGRLLEPSDTIDSEWVTVINQTFARELWGDDDPIGRAVVNYRDEPITVVGVVRDVKLQSLDEEPTSAMYVSHPQALIPWQTSRATVVVRAQGDPLDLVSAARAEVHEVDPLLPVASVRTLNEVVRATVAAPRFRLALIGSFAVTALVLAALGVYGVVRYTVSRTLRDVAVRVALGAADSRIVRHVLRTGLLPVAIGTVVGMGAAALVSGTLESMLFAVEPIDPIAFLAVPILLLAVATVACWLPARRATRIDPMRLLREE